MKNIVCSIALKKNVVAILIVEDGMIKRRATERVKDESVLDSSYSAMIYAFTVALRYVRDYIQQGNGEYSVCFETSNSTFVKWVENQYSKAAYQDAFIAALKLLQELPIMYAFHYCPKPKAVAYADEKYCKKEKLSGLDVEGVDDGE